MMLRKIHKAYLYFFWRLAYFAKAFADDGFHEWKTSLLISVLEGFLILALVINIEIITGYSIIPAGGNEQKIIIAVFAIAITIINYSILIHKKRWLKYEEEFMRYSKKFHVINGFLILGILLLVVSIVIVSFYLLSQTVQ